jgi:hypothetical protein
MAARSLEYVLVAWATIWMVAQVASEGIDRSSEVLVHMVLNSLPIALESVTNRTHDRI